MPPDLSIETALWQSGHQLLAGVDEAGRGPLAGPVVAAAVIVLPRVRPIAGVDDSKKLSPAKRERLFAEICGTCLFALSAVGPEEIDRINILQASREAMRRAVGQLPENPHYVLVDGNQPLALETPQRTLVRGDARSYAIACASILAKVTRDRLMSTLDTQYPQYGFAGHKGYPTRAHKEALRRHGPSPVHRRTFRGVRELLA